MYIKYKMMQKGWVCIKVLSDMSLSNPLIGIAHIIKGMVKTYFNIQYSET